MCNRVGTQELIVFYKRPNLEPPKTITQYVNTKLVHEGATKIVAYERGQNMNCVILVSQNYSKGSCHWI